jgi:hypothetical protein
MGLKPSPKHCIERVDNNGDYCPKNCRWATHTEQMRNTRRTRLLTLDGITKPLTQWAEELGIKPKSLRARIDDNGWSVERALTTPTQT